MEDELHSMKEKFKIKEIKNFRVIGNIRNKLKDRTY